MKNYIFPLDEEASAFVGGLVTGMGIGVCMTLLFIALYMWYICHTLVFVEINSWQNLLSVVL